jgi:hypothetical protein
MKVIIYGDFNRAFSFLASQPAGRPVARPGPDDRLAGRLA